MISVLIIDDQKTIRRALQIRLNLEKDLQVIGEASSGEEALFLASKLKPDVMLMDLAMPGMDGLTTALKLREKEPEIGIIVLSIHDNEFIRLEAQMQGVVTFVRKQGVEELLTAIRKVATPHIKQPLGQA